MKVAGGTYTRDMSKNHFTTSGFGQLQPIYCEQVLPNDKVTIHPSCFSRSTPTALPNLGKLSFTQRCFFVAYVSVWKYFNDFITNNPVSINDSATHIRLKQVPTFSSLQLTNVFTSTSYGLSKEVMNRSTSGRNSTWFDFLVEDTQISNTFKYYQFTKRGKFFYKLLCALGYNFNFCNSSQTYLYERYNALDLMCYFKIIYDRYIPSTLRPSSYLDTVFSQFNLLTPNSNGVIEVPTSLLGSLFSNDTIYYDNNYFTSQWLNLNEPVPNFIGNTQYRVTEGQINQSQDHTMDIGATSSDVAMVNTSNPLTATRNIMLSSLRKFILRNNLVGSKPIERLFAHFGVHVPELELQMAKYCGSYDLPVQNMDVTSMGSDTETLGVMAGKSFVAQDKEHTFKVDCDQHGVVMVLHSIDTPSMYVSGVRRRLKHIFPLDFYTPDFDDTTLQATAGSELYGQNKFAMSKVNSELHSYGLDKSSIFGYSARFDEYRKPIDDVSGDYLVPSLNEPIDAYINPRRLFDDIAYQLKVTEYVEDASPTTSPNDVNLADFTYLPVIVDNQQVTPVDIVRQDDAVQFNRIYKDYTGISDPFNVHWKFKVTIVGSVKNEDLALFVDGHGKEISPEKGGQKFD